MAALCLLGGVFSCERHHFTSGNVKESRGGNGLTRERKRFGLRCHGNSTPSGSSEQGKRQVCSGKDDRARNGGVEGGGTEG